MFREKGFRNLGFSYLQSDHAVHCDEEQRHRRELVARSGALRHQAARPCDAHHLARRLRVQHRGSLLARVERSPGPRRSSSTHWAMLRDKGVAQCSL